MSSLDSQEATSSEGNDEKSQSVEENAQIKQDLSHSDSAQDEPKETITEDKSKPVPESSGHLPLEGKADLGVIFETTSDTSLDINKPEDLEIFPDQSNSAINLDINKTADLEIILEGFPDSSTSGINIDVNTELLEELSDNQDDEITLRWDDDDSEELMMSKSDSLAEIIPMPNSTVDKDIDSSDNKSVVKDDNNQSTPLEGNISVDIATSSHDSSSDGSICLKTDHGLNKPDVMLEIPSQGMFDDMDEYGDEMLSDKEEAALLDFVPDSEDLSDLVRKEVDTISKTISSIEETEAEKLKISTDNDEEEQGIEPCFERDGTKSVANPPSSQKNEIGDNALIAHRPKIKDEEIDVNLRVSSLINSIEEEMLLIDSSKDVIEKRESPPPVVEENMDDAEGLDKLDLSSPVQSLSEGEDVSEVNSDVISLGDDDEEPEAKEKELEESEKKEKVEEKEPPPTLEQELEMAVKAIEQNNEVEELPPLVSIVNQVPEGEQHVSDTDDQASISLVLDDDDEEIDEAKHSTDSQPDAAVQDEIPIIQDSDDDSVSLVKEELSQTVDVDLTSNEDANDNDDDIQPSSSLSPGIDNDNDSITQDTEAKLLEDIEQDTKDQSASVSPRREEELLENLGKKSELHGPEIKNNNTEDLPIDTETSEAKVIGENESKDEQVVSSKEISEQEPTSDTNVVSTSIATENEEVVNIAQIDAVSISANIKEVKSEQTKDEKVTSSSSVCDSENKILTISQDIVVSSTTAVEQIKDSTNAVQILDDDTVSKEMDDIPLADEIQILDDESQETGERQQKSDMSPKEETISKALDDISQKVNDMSQASDTISQNMDDTSQVLDEISQKVDDVSQVLDDASQKVGDVSQASDVNGEKSGDIPQRNDDISKSTDDRQENLDDISIKSDGQEKSKGIVQSSDMEQEVDGTSQEVDDTSKGKTHQRTDLSEQSVDKPHTSDNEQELGDLPQKPEQKDNQPQGTETKADSILSESRDTSNDAAENSDSLGLLAESTGRMMDDDDQDDEEDDGEYYFIDDESSSQMAAEHSEDSNAQHSETDRCYQRETHDGNTDNAQGFAEKETDTPEDRERNTSNVVTEDEKLEQESVEFDMDQEESDDKAKDNNERLDKKEQDKSVHKAEKPTSTGDVETVRLSDTSDNEVDAANNDGAYSLLRNILTTAPIESEKSAESEQANKLKNLAVSQKHHVLNYVDLEESSSEDDIQLVTKAPVTRESPQPEPQPEPPKDSGDAQPVIELPEAPPAAPPAVDVDAGDTLTDDVLETADKQESSSTVPIIAEEQPTTTPEEDKGKSKQNQEVFNLDSDDEDTSLRTAPVEEAPPPPEEDKSHDNLKCVNLSCNCTHDTFYTADAGTVAYYDGDKRKRHYVCEGCMNVVNARNQELIAGIRNYTPLLQLDMSRFSQQLVEISDSESDGEGEGEADELKQTLGERDARFVEEQLVDMINETWEKYRMDSRLSDTEAELQMDLKKLESDSKEIDALLNECQAATDKLRNELYATFTQEIRELPPLVIFDTPEQSYIHTKMSPDNAQPAMKEPEPSSAQTRLAKRRLEAAAEIPAKRPAIPLGYTPLDTDFTQKGAGEMMSVSNEAFNADGGEKIEDEVAVVQLSAEAAPPGLPAPGAARRPPLRAGLRVRALRTASTPWLPATIAEVVGKSPSTQFTMCKVKFDVVSKNPYKMLPGRSIAYDEIPDARLTIGTRVIALFRGATNEEKRDCYYSGIIAEVPNPVNGYRYLIFFDDGYAQYAWHGDTRLVAESAAAVWDEVHPLSREFVRKYLLEYPERPMVRLHPWQNLKTEWKGKWWSSRVVAVDASLAQVHFTLNGRYEWIYRGSTRLAPLYLELQAAERRRPRAVPRTQAHSRSNMPVVEYTTEEQNKSADNQVDLEETEDTRTQRAVARKSTAGHVDQPPTLDKSVNLDNVTSRVVYYTPKNAVKPFKMSPHTCSSKCRRTDVLELRELRTYNPLAKPLLSGWERHIVRFKGQKEVMYRAPCGRRLRSMPELHRYLVLTQSDMPVDLFDFGPNTHCLAEFVLNKCLTLKKDLSLGKETVPVPCVNYYDTSLPAACAYRTERTPTAGVPLNLDPAFLCGCDCEGDCEDKSKCACWKMTLEGARTIGLHGNNVGYVYKRLPEPLPSGIYECNSRCNCRKTCLNRVAQHPLQLKLQVFKTINRGWGIRALNDVPKGAFVCVYAGNLLTDATANLDGLNEGDEYLAELDYIEVVEQMKEGYEEDIPEAIKKLDMNEKGEDDEESSSEEEAPGKSKTECEDEEFRPATYVSPGGSEFSKHLRQRKKNKENQDNAEDKDKKKEGDKEKKEEKKEDVKEDKKEVKKEGEEDCITISDDEEVREPSRFAAADGMGANEFVSKYKSVRALFGEDEACYIMDAKVQGNIGRYLNHSCAPNVFVQNVFVDTHDPRFPWVAFFALAHIRAGTELTWNYNYDVGSVPGKVLYCYCGAPNCRRRLL